MHTHLLSTSNIFVPVDPGGDAAGAGGQRPESRGDPGQDAAAAEGDGRGQLPRLHQQDAQERAQCGESQQR